MMDKIHATAIIEDGAKLAKDVEIGPYCVVGKHVKIGAGTRLKSHVVIQGHTTIGAHNTIYPFTSIGQNSPDRKYKGEVAYLEIGNDNDIREYVNIHVGTGVGKGITRIGAKNLLMAMTHVAHDCVIGDNCTIANGVQLAGHVEISDNVTIGGLTGLKQHIRIGKHAFIAGHVGVDRDVPPYANVAGRRARLEGLNLVGLRRYGLSNKEIFALKSIYNDLFFNKENDAPLMEKIEHILSEKPDDRVLDVLEFLKNAQRGTTLPRED